MSREDEDCAAQEVEKHLTPVIDKSKWADGPWKTEPDRLEWRSSGVPCLIVRANFTGALSGYVGVFRGHPWHRLDFDDVDVTVHGGLTYSKGDAAHTYYTPQPGDGADIWWFGFDCAHGGDACPALTKLGGAFGEVYKLPMQNYKDVDYVRGEVESLVQQVLAAR